MIELSIATGRTIRSRETKIWKNQTITWNALVKKFSDPIRTHETYAQYKALGNTKEGKEEQANIKDKGGFVGGYLKDGRRNPYSVEHRQLITLDIDFSHYNFWEDFTCYFGNAAVIHSTHKHSPGSPRYRLIMPLSRRVSKEEYEAIARKVASYLDIEIFDPTTFQPERLMFWPTVAKDGDWVFEQQKGDWLNADEILKSYDDWRDISSWPVHDEETVKINKGLKLQGDPKEKPGLIGAFCRTYDIHEAIETFLPDVYEKTDFDDRYTFVEGSAAAGAIVYGDSADFLYSHHGTDPIHGVLCNSFDLVRLHKFGHEDTDGDTTEITKRKSYRLMNDYAKTITEVVKEYGVARISSQSDFDDGFEVDREYNNAWLGKLKFDKYNKYDSTTTNFELIIKHDPRLSNQPYYDKGEKPDRVPLGNLRYDKFNLRPVSTKPLPWNAFDGERQWTDEDDAGLRHYLETEYGIYNATKCKDSLMLVFRQNAFHPITDYINKLEWDGLERLDTLLIDYLGAADTRFTRLATRKAFVAAVARVYEPGIKFDYVLTLMGKEGIKKSMLLGKMFGKWFSDSFVGVEGNKAYEQLQGAWGIEMGELSGIKRSEAEAVKHFITKREDRFRVAYGTRIEGFPRQCVFFGSTNEYAFLRDNNGNRRFWPVQVNAYGLLHIDDLPIDQLWAEAKQYYDWKEPLYLDEDVEQEAKEVQNQHTETDDRTGMIVQYLDTLLPINWETMKLHERKAFLHDPEAQFNTGEWPRLKVCVAEIWCELLQSPLKEMTTHNTKYIHAIMEKLPGWEKTPSNLSFGIYGKQRAYKKVELIKREQRSKNKTNK